MPSLASKVTLALSCIITASTVCYVHYKQVDDRWQLHQGISKEFENRKVENLRLLDQQRVLEEAYRKEEDGKN